MDILGLLIEFGSNMEKVETELNKLSDWNDSKVSISKLDEVVEALEDAVDSDLGTLKKYI